MEEKHVCRRLWWCLSTCRCMSWNVSEIVKLNACSILLRSYNSRVTAPSKRFTDASKRMAPRLTGCPRPGPPAPTSSPGATPASVTPTPGTVTPTVPQRRMPPPIVFLDVDGVLHSAVGDNGLFFPQCMSALRTIIEATGAVIVLSSAWQAHEQGRADLVSVLTRWGLPIPVAMTVNGSVPGTGEERRAREISSWVRAHGQICRRWVALDDLPLETVATPPAFVPLVAPSNFVRTNDQSGLTPADAHRAIALLGGRDPGAPKLPPPQPDAIPVVQPSAQKPAPPGHEVWRTDAPRYGGMAVGMGGKR